ncbi:MAG: hypothetical protein N3D11_15430 [Candidatus Sumerlaeia bacterium]|nr:hypothetical protein [Candidatus Sumerlaeia bacterium]
MSQKQWFACVVSFSLLLSVLGCILSPVAWSPDGRWITYTNLIIGEKKSDSDSGVVGTELWIVSPDTLERRRLLATSDTLSGPAWAADSKALYVMLYSDKGAKGRSAALQHVGLDGSARVIAQFENTQEPEGGSLTAPALSPDGSRIAAMRDGTTVVILDTNGKLIRSLAVDKAQHLDWSPDSRWLAAMLDGGGQGPNVQFFDVQTSDTFVLDARFQGVTWLPGSRRFVSIKRVETGDGGARFSLAVMEPGTPVREIADHPVLAETGRPLVVSRDGTLIYFAHNEDEKPLSMIRCMNLTNGETKTVYETPGLVVPWALSPDGKRVAFRESPRGDGALQSVAGVVNTGGSGEAVFLPVTDKQLAEIVTGYAKMIRQAAADTASLEDIRKAAAASDHVEKLLAAFRRDFPKSPLLAPCEKALNDARAEVVKTGRSLSPDAGAPKW